MTTPPEYVDEDHANIAEFAERFLDEDERESFVDHLMERRGYQRVHSWAPGDGGGGQDPGEDGEDGAGGGQSSRGRGHAGGRGRGPGAAAARGGPRRAPYFKR